jgi:cytoskeletal protein CcmA (bactofilin family)
MEMSEQDETLRTARPPLRGNGTGQVNGSDNVGLDGQARPEESLMSVIGTDILVTGNIEAEVDLHIEGRVKGDVRCSTLILGERSSVTGNVFAERVRVSGRVEGGIETTDLAIESTARVKGDVTYSRLRIANGGIIQGTMTHKPLDEAAAEDARLELAEAEPAVAPRVKAKAEPKVHFID